MHRHLFALMRQVLIGAACNRLHTMEKRCARWLLMNHTMQVRIAFHLRRSSSLKCSGFEERRSMQRQAR
jgi:hypothetical protein